MTQNANQIERVREYLGHLTLQERSHLLAEIERLKLCDEEMPGSDVILAELHAELRNAGQSQNQTHGVDASSHYFFQPLEPFLINHSPEHANPGEISRGSLSAIWEWMCHDLLPAMATDYAKQLKHALASNDLQGAGRIAAAFQTKVAGYVENTLASPAGVERVRAALATYTSWPATFDDLAKVMCVLHMRDALVQFGNALPPRIGDFEGEPLAKVRALLDAFAIKHAPAVPFALTLVARRLATPWQLIRLATRIADSKDAADIATAPYAVAVTMVLGQLDTKRLALRRTLRNNRIAVAKEILVDIYDTEYALRVRIDLHDDSGWGHRLNELMKAIAVVVDTEVKQLPGNVRHVLGARGLHRHDSLKGRLIYLAWKGRDALAGLGAYCRRLMSPAARSHP